MEFYHSPPLLLSIFICFPFLFFARFCFAKRNSTKLPPGPNPLPILGNILQLTDQPHRALATLSATYGPLMYIKLGSIPTIVVSSSAVAKQVLHTHDLVFSGRKVPDAVRALDHNLHSVAWLPVVSPKWRQLRKIYAVQLFSAKRLDESRFLRQAKVGEMLEYVSGCCERGEGVRVGEVGFTTSLNLLSNTLFSVDLGSYDSEVSNGLKDVIREIFDYLGKPNFADFFPLLRYVDPLGIRRNTAACFAKLFAVFDDMIKQRLSTDSAFVGKEDVLQTLLQINKEEGSDLSLDDIKHLLLDIIAAGTDTTSSTVEWAMTELLCNPSKMVKAEAELEEIIGKGAPVMESDIQNMPYLQAIVKETMRLHPSVPLLLPHKAEENIEICSYMIPKDTQVIVNAWGIGRDLGSWKNPSEFLPERFLGCEIDVRGGEMELIPFGGGRRICPGLPLAYRMMHLMLASLIHGFGWKLGEGLRIEDVDMSERFGLSLEKAKPLVAIPLSKK